MTFPDPEATWLPRASAEEVGSASSNLTRFVAPGQDVHGEFGLFELAMPPGRPGPVPHYHTGFSESFYVVSGRLAVLTGREWRVAGSGDFVHVPPHGMHAFRTPDGDEQVRFLILFVPGAPRERYFRGLAEFGRREVPPTAAEVDEFARGCDQVNVRDWETTPL
jgi:quercetin dioxygenase-like cupin family protein